MWVSPTFFPPWQKELVRSQRWLNWFCTLHKYIFRFSSILTIYLPRAMSTYKSGPFCVCVYTCVRILIFIPIHISRPVQKRRFWHWIKSWRRPSCRFSEIGTYFHLLSFVFTAARGNKKKEGQNGARSLNTLSYNTFQTSAKKGKKVAETNLFAL